MRIDLHIHSNASDGEHRPEELVNIAAADGIGLMALTDHDTVDGLAEASRAADSAGMRFLPGIEISTELDEECLRNILIGEMAAGCSGRTDDSQNQEENRRLSADRAGACIVSDFSPEERKLMLNEDIHVLGLGINPDDARIRTFCDKYKNERLNRGPKICSFLAGIGIDVDMDEVHEIRGTASLGRPHFAEFLIRHGYVSSKKEAFDKYLDTDEFNAATKRLKPTPYDAIRIIHAAGGKAVLAHPGLLKFKGRSQESVIESLAGEGLDGIECFYNKHDEDQTDYYLSLMKRLGLKTGCGSDFHGKGVKPEVEIGMELPENYLRDLVVIV